MMKAIQPREVRYELERCILKFVTIPTHGDLLITAAGQRHIGFSFSLARSIWSRTILKKFFPGLSLFILAEARK